MMSIKKLKKIIDKVYELTKQPKVYLDEIPKELHDDFKEYIIGKTMGSENGRSVIYDMSGYFMKIVYHGAKFSNEK